MTTRSNTSAIVADVTSLVRALRAGRGVDAKEIDTAIELCRRAMQLETIVEQASLAAESLGISVATVQRILDPPRRADEHEPN